MKSRRVEAAAADADERALSAAAVLPFRVITLQRIAYGSKTAEFSIETPIGVIQADLFTPEGREPLVSARSVRDKFTGQWRRTIALDRTFAARVLDALRGPATAADKKSAGQKPQAVEPSEVLLESERRFDAAFEELDAGVT